MIRLALRCLPADGRHELSWYTGLTGALDQIYQFLLRAQIANALAAGAEYPARRADVTRRIVDGWVAELGGPVIRHQAPATVIELAVPVAPGTLAVQALAEL